MNNNSYDKDQLIQFLKERHPFTYKEYIRSITPNYLECGIEYYHYNLNYISNVTETKGHPKSAGWILVGCHFYSDHTVYVFEHKNKDENGRGRGFQLNSNDPKLFAQIERVDENVEYKRNLYDMRQHFTLLINGFRMYSYLMKFRDHASEKLCIRYFVEPCDQTIGRKVELRYYGHNKKEEDCFSLTLYWGGSYNRKEDHIGHNFNMKLAKYAMENLVVYGDFNVSVGEVLVYGGKSTDTLKKGERYTCEYVRQSTDRSIETDITVIDKNGKKIRSNKFKFYRLADVRKNKIKKLNFYLE